MPQGADRTPEALRQPFLIGIGVLDDQKRDILRSPVGETKSDRPTKILHVEAISLEAQSVRELLDHVSQLIEGVRKRALPVSH